MAAARGHSAGTLEVSTPFFDIEARPERDDRPLFPSGREEALVTSAEILTPPPAPTSSHWVANADLLWEKRRTLVRVGVVALTLGAVIAFTTPKQYESTGRLMPPDQQGSGSAMLAALAGRATGGIGGLGSLAGLLGARTSSALFIEMMQSRTISDHLIDRFHLQEAYHKRYRIDTVKYLGKHTVFVEDKKSGVITLTYTDTDKVRAQAIAQAYFEELNAMVTRNNVSSARREREFIEKRLVSAQSELQDAQKALSEFSSVNTTLDIKEQTHAMVDAAAKLQAEVIVGQSELESLEQIYGTDNVRVRAARARIGSLQQELAKLSGSSAAVPLNTGETTSSDGGSLYPSLRQLPRLAVPYANLYRTVRIQETVFELLSQQFEMARIEEAKDTPVVSVIDPPQIAEKKSYPPRLLMMLILTMIAEVVTAVIVLCRAMWAKVDAGDPRKLLATKIAAGLPARLMRRRAA
jgi:uncharacterized protein involved in exopolysaccharide biosynthesis